LRAFWGSDAGTACSGVAEAVGKWDAGSRAPLDATWRRVYCCGIGTSWTFIASATEV